MIKPVVLLFLLTIPVQSYALSEKEVAVCTGMSNAIRDNSIGTDKEPLLVFYGELFKGILKDHEQIPNSVLESYTYGYKIGTTYTRGNLGDLYWECVSKSF
jgi:hypothetical protein